MSQDKKDKQKKKERIKKIINSHIKEKEEYLDGWKRAKADLENYKKDEHKRTSFLIKQERKSFILKLIGVLDNFSRAEKEAEKTNSSAVFEGFLNIKKQIEAILKEEGVEEIKAHGKEFDPEFHEAVEVIQAKDQESGLVVEELEKGYILEGEVVRASKVKVAQ